MKTFNYTAREANGKVRQGSLVAQDRAAAVAALRGQGVVPLSLTEGAAKPLGSGRSLLRSMPRVVVVGVAVVLVLVAASLILMNRRQPAKVVAAKSNVQQVPDMIKPVKGVASEKRSGSTEPVAPAVSVPLVVQGPAGVAQAAAAPPVVAQAQAPGGAPNVARRRPGVHILDQDGKEINKPRPELKTQTDRFLWAVLNSKGSGMIPIAPAVIARDFAKALQAKVEIMPDDTAEDIANKAAIERLKQEINGMLQEGHELVDVLQVIQKERNAISEYRRGVQNTLFTLVKEGKLEDAATYQEAANQELATEQALPLYVPDKLLKAGEKKAEEIREQGR